MPPKRITVQPATRRGQPKGYFSSVYHTLTSEENASVVLSVAMFGVCIPPVLSSFPNTGTYLVDWQYLLPHSGFRVRNLEKVLLTFKRRK
jgi:hypothetical protein